MKCVLVVLLLLSSLPAIHAQGQTTAVNQPASEKETRVRKVGEDFIAAYNRQDFDAMRNNFSTILKAFLPKKAWSEGWRIKYAKYGAITTKPADLKATAGGSLIIPVGYALDTTKRENIRMYVSPKGSVQGYGMTTDPYAIYPVTISADRLSAAVDSVMAETFPKGFGGTVLFASEGHATFLKHWGYNDLRSKTPLNDSSVFELASCSKQFTAAAILKLQEMGKVSPDDPLQKFFPEVPYPDVKVRHLIHHTAGLPSYEAYLAGKKVKKPFVYNADVIAMLASRKADPQFAPGSTYEYSNTGYAVLASIVEKASGMSYADFLAQQFFTPLGMTHTRVYNGRRTRGEVIPNYAYGYVWSEKKKDYFLPDSLKETSYVIKLDGIVGDGTVNTTALDLVKWSVAMQTPGAVFSEASLQAISAPDTLTSGKTHNYGYGVDVRRTPNTELILAHTGGWPGYQTIVYRFPEKKKLLVILGNRESPEDNIVEAGRKLSGLLLGQ